MLRAHASLLTLALPHACITWLQGEATLLEPLPALLSCVHKLVSQMPPDAGGSSGGAGGDDSWQDAGDHSSSAALKVCLLACKFSNAVQMMHCAAGSCAGVTGCTWR